MGIFSKLFGAKKNAPKGLTDAAYEGYARAFDGAVLNSIHIQKTAAAAPISVGHSKMGGMPDLPEGFSWPYFTGTDFDGVTASRPLAFLAQFNLGEVAPHDRDGRLPGSGMLYFFYEAHTMLWGFDPADRGCARVFYVKENAKLTRKNFPDDLEEQYILPEMALNFSTSNELPDIAEQRFGIVDFDEYQQACTRYGCPMNESCSTKLLGYADLIQGDITYECEAVSRGVYCGGSDEGLSDDERAYIQAHAADWVLLAQFDGIHSGGYELDWGDDGCLYFYIKKEDARARDFSKCWCVLQCM